MRSGDWDELTNRRAFLRELGAGIVSLSGAGALLRSRAAWADGAKPFQVAILGAGVAGLCAAYELEKLGHQVTIFEADPDRLGGRVRTHRFEGGQYGELGAMRIPQSHALTRHYVAELGLQLREFVNFNPHAFYYVDGVRHRIEQMPSLDSRYAYQGARRGFWGQRFDEIVGGTEALPLALASRLRSVPRLGCEVISIEQPASGRPVVVFSDQGVQDRFEADFVLCTLPFPVIESHDPLLSSFSPAKQSVIHELDYVSASKTLVLTNSRFWESRDGIFGGATFTDLPTGSVYYPSSNAVEHSAQISAEPGVLLASYALGDTVTRLKDWPGNQRVARALTALAPIHPQLSDPGVVLDAKAWNWDDHPWAQGGFAADGQGRKVLRAQEPDGRIYFAGEHTSYNPAWMQGALESALRAVGEMTSVRLRALV